MFLPVVSIRTIRRAGRAFPSLGIVALSIVIMLFVGFAGQTALAAKTSQEDSALVLDAAESVFKNMAAGDWRALWSGLSDRTRNEIVNSVRKALSKEDRSVSNTDLFKDFASGGPIAGDYWKGYLSRFDPKSVLEESRWSMGEIKKNKAFIILRYRKSNHDALLQMFFEKGGWKVGLHETFHTRE
jgi:hypothetical protein